MISLYNIGTRHSLILSNYTVFCVANRQVGNRYLLLFYCIRTDMCSIWYEHLLDRWPRLVIVVIIPLCSFLTTISRLFVVPKEGGVESGVPRKSKKFAIMYGKNSIRMYARFPRDDPTATKIMDLTELSFTRERRTPSLLHGSQAFIVYCYGVIIVRVRRRAHFTHNFNYCS